MRVSICMINASCSKTLTRSALGGASRKRKAGQWNILMGIWRRSLAANILEQAGLRAEPNSQGKK